MRTSHSKIKKRIHDEKLKISDEEIFSNAAFAGYLNDIGEATMNKAHRRIKSTTVWDESPRAPIAYTDSRKIVINCGNRITQSFPTRLLRSNSIIGLDAHERAHILYTDFATYNMYNTSLKYGRIFPKIPEDLTSMELKNLDSMVTMLEENIVAQETVPFIGHHLANILEDVYVEERMSCDFPGTYAAGIQLNNVRMIDLVPSIKEEIKRNDYEISMLSNFLVQYCRSGELNNLGGYSGEYLDAINDCIPVIDEAIYDTDFKARLNAVNTIMAKWWNYIKKMIDDIQNKADDAGIKDDDALREFVQKSLGTYSSQVAAGPELPSSSLGASSSATNASASKFAPRTDDEKKEDQQRWQDVIAEETSRIALTKTDSISTVGTGEITKNNFYAGTGYSKSAHDIERLLNTMAKERVYTLMEEELSDEIQREANQIRYGNAHEGVDVMVNRMSSVPDDLQTQYESIISPLRQISKNLQKQVRQMLKDQGDGGRQNGLYMGHRINARAFAQTDGKLFYKNRLPDGGAKIAVSLLVDESGSMCGDDRITSARATSLVLYDFCKGLHIPVMISGHDSDGSNVNIYSYAEFESVDSKDGYRIMDMSARGCNRDGAAVRYACERLSKRPEPIKLFILISDGQPAATDYYGTEAEADLRGIKQEFTRRGIIMFAAAIGEDRENIKRIYQDGFLDITDLQSLPATLTKLLTRYIKQTTI